jgi:hypothetical protein
MHVTLIDANGFAHDVNDVPAPLPYGMRRVGGTDAQHPGVREYHRVGTSTKYREAATHDGLAKAHCASNGCKAPTGQHAYFAAPYQDGVAFVCADCYPEYRKDR